MRRACAVVLIALLPALAVRGASAQAAPADGMVFYKCTDAKGNTSLQNGTPCAPGMKQEVRRIGEVRTVPVPERKPVVEAPPAPPVYGEFVLVSGPNMKRKPSAEAAALPPPPALYQCTSWDGETYFGETGTPPPRCAPLQVTGIDGSAALGAGSACEMKDDTCNAIPAEGLCDAWLRRLDDADFKLKYAGTGNRAERKAAFDAIDAKVKASNCSPDAPAAAQKP